MKIAILGSGSAAFACALQAAQENADITLIESNVVGGTCVNVGCVPSKVFLRAAHTAYSLQHHPFKGIHCEKSTLDRKQQVIQQQQRVDELREKKYLNLIQDNPRIRLLNGMAAFKDKNTLVIKTNHSEKTISFDCALIATGASPFIPNIEGIKDAPYWTSTEALVAEEIPQHLIILGGSAVGLEIGQAFLHEGAKVTVIDVASLLPKEDPDVGTYLENYLKEEGMQILTKTNVKMIQYGEQQFHIQLNDQTLQGDRLLVATGRIPNTHYLNLEKISIKTTSRGGVQINDFMQTNISSIYAAGDCTDLPQFVYVAAAAGTRAAMNMLGGQERLNLSTMPSVTFTSPQATSVGMTATEAQEKGIAVETRLLTLDNVPRALANFDTRGFIKLVAEQKTGRLVGAQILAAEGGELIQTAALAIKNKMTVKEIAEQLFPYLTMVEGIKLCAQTFFQDVSQLSCCAGG